jgi:sialate O-acetylesterase
MNLKPAITFIILLFSQFIFAQNIHLTSIFGNKMVIQRGIHAPVWGYASPGSSIHVDFAGTISTTRSGDDGKWMLRMPILKAGGPYTMKVYAIDTLRFNDVMVGDVWLASGQSNMEWRMGSGVGPGTAKEIAEANFPNIRFFAVPRKTSCIPLNDLEMQDWKCVSPATVKELSAVAFFFAKDLHVDKKVAVGIISSSWGATSVEAWMSAEMLSTHPDFKERVLKIDRHPEKWNIFVESNMKADRDRDSIAKAAKEGLKKGVHTLGYDHSTWAKAYYPVDMAGIGLGGFWGVVWLRKTFDIPKDLKGKKLNISLDMRARDVVIYFNGTEIGMTVNPDKTIDYDIPGKIVKAGNNVLAIRMYVNWGSASVGTKESIAAITSGDKKVNIVLDGAWYGNGTIEPPVPQWQNYYNNITVQYNARIAPLTPFGLKGIIWYQGENNAGKAFQYQTLFPMMIQDWRTQWGQGYLPFLFVQLANYKAKKIEPSDDDWAELREAQAMALQQPNTGMACAIDIGDANDIHPKNKEDVGKRLYLAARKVAYDENIISSGPVYQSMQIEGGKIRLKFTSIGNGLTTRNNETLKGFSIAGKDNKFCWADAKIDRDEIVVSAIKVEFPLAVRYSWESNPDGNLYNKEGLPAPPFRTDNLRLITQSNN